MTFPDGRLRLLIIEDHIPLAQNLEDFFDTEQYQLDFANDGLTALHLLANNQYDLIILDIGLPGIGGLEICKRIRNDLCSEVPIIIMTAECELASKEEGFINGADDYIVKPFQLRELELRIHALYRRSSGASDSIIQAGDISFNLGTLAINIKNQHRLTLSGMGARIFEVIIRAHPNFVSYQELHEKLWPQRELDINVIRTHVYSLRKRLKDHTGEAFISTLHSRGYKLDVKNNVY